MQVAARGVFGRPDADRIFRYRIERPEQLARLRIIGFHEAADAVFAAIRSDQNLVVDHRRRHRLAIAELRIRDVGLPGNLAGLCLQSHKLGVKRGNVDEVAENLDAAIVGTAAVRRHQSHLVIVVPELRAGFRVERIDMAERGRHIHDAVDDDGRSLQRFLDVGLENPGDVQVLDVAAIDLSRGMKARLGIIAVGQQKIGCVLVCRVELLLSNRRNRCLAHHRLGFLFNLLRDAWPCEEACQAERRGAYNRKSIHVPAPHIVIDANRLFFRRCVPNLRSIGPA